MPWTVPWLANTFTRFFARYGYVLVLRLEQHGYLGAPTQTQRLANGVQVQYKVPDTKTEIAAPLGL